MVAWGCNNRNSSVYPVRSLMPLSPLWVHIMAINKVSCMKCKCSSWGVSKCLPKYSWPVSLYFILRITKVNKTKWFLLRASSFEMIILCPIYTISNSICIKSIWLQVPKDDAMIMSLIDVAFKISCFCFEFFWIKCPSIWVCYCYLSKALWNRCVCSPVYCLGWGRIIIPS